MVHNGEGKKDKEKQMLKVIRGEKKKRPKQKTWFCHAHAALVYLHLEGHVQFVSFLSFLQ